MSLSPNEKYPGATEADPNYKDSKFKDNNPSTTNNGSPLKALDRNEQLALQEAVMNAAGFDYNGVVDTPQNSQMFAAYKAALSNGANLLSNHNFLIASPDDSQPAPSATPTSYPPGFQIFSGVFANETTGILNLTYIDGRVSFSGGDFHMAVPNTGALENITEFVASVADFDGKPRTRGVSYALVGDEYRVTVGVDALEDAGAVLTPLGSVKFEQGSEATGHEVGAISTGNLSDYTDIVYKSSAGSSAVANMIADFAANPLMRAVGTIIKTGGTTWVYEDSTGPITEDNFRALNVRSVVDYGATGDGVTDDTQAFIDARGDISNPRALYAPTPKVSYLVSNLQLGKECRIDGDGKYKSRIIGDNTNPILLFGDGVNGAYRDNEIHGLTLSNNGAPCVVGEFSPNWIINNCTLRSTGGDGTFNTVSFSLSPRGNFSHNIGGIVGSGFALSFTDNCNGQVVHHNIWTGGTSGGAMKCGQSQVISFKWNIIESSLDGVYVASTSGVGEGICSSVEIENNYFEQCRNPIVLGTVFIVKGWSVKKNIVSNGDFNVVPSRDASYKFGRVFDGEFSENYTTVASNGSENFIDFVLNQNNDLQGNTFKKGRLENTPLALAAYSGSLANDSSTRQNFGGFNYLNFLSLASTEYYKEYYSPTFTGNVGTSTVAWINETILELGGKIFSVEVIEKQGDLTGAFLQVGDNADPDRLVNLDLESPIYEFGYYDIPLTHPTNHIRKQNKNLVRNIAGTGSGTYRVLVKYRAI